MVDAFVSQSGDEFECVKHVSFNEPYFTGHFPHHPVMPGVLIIEALAQAAAAGTTSGPPLSPRQTLTPGSKLRVVQRAPFGGPIALVSRMRTELVDQRGWLAEDEFNAGIAFAQLAIGPALG